MSRSHEVLDLDTLAEELEETMLDFRSAKGELYMRNNTFTDYKKPFFAARDTTREHIVVSHLTVGSKMASTLNKLDKYLSIQNADRQFANEIYREFVATCIDNINYCATHKDAGKQRNRSIELRVAENLCNILSPKLAKNAPQLLGEINEVMQNPQMPRIIKIEWEKFSSTQKPVAALPTLPKTATPKTVVRSPNQKRVHFEEKPSGSQTTLV